MNEIQIYHEAPLSIFDKVAEETFGDYALVHLLDSNAEYADKFVKLSQKPNRRPIILDNSAYELGEAFNETAFAEWIEILQPDTYVVPDTMGDAWSTLEAFVAWKKAFKGLPGKKMGVVQGDSMTDAAMCYDTLADLGADIIGIPFLIGKTWSPEYTPQTLLRDRARLLEYIHLVCRPCPTHLLGVALPQEGYHVTQLPWIESIDTSNPVVHGLFNIRYNDGGLNEKKSELLANLINSDVSDEQETIIFDNIRKFKQMWRRPA